MRKLQRLVTFTFVSALSICFSTAIAATLQTVTINKLDGTQSGWKSAVESGAKASISRQMPKGDPGPLPPGSVYFKTGLTSSPVPAQSWVGTNAFDGVYLKNISKLEYYTYMVKRGQENTPPGFYPYQPMQLQMAVKNEANGWIWYIMFRPWGVPEGGDPTGNQCGMWQRWDCLDPNNKWYEAWDSTFGNVRSQGFTWQQLRAAWPDLKIYSPGAGNRFPDQTSTGCGLNFVCGARTTTGSSLFPLTAWWRESYNAEGSMDAFKIGLIKNGSYEETTYDFDVSVPAVKPNAYVTTIKALMRGNWWLDGDVYSATSNPYGKWTAQQVIDNMNEIQKNANTNNSLYVVCGKVVEDARSNADWFCITDGSGLVLPVYAQGHGLVPGKFVSVKGAMKPPMPYDWGQARAYDHSAPGVLNTSTQPFIPTLEPTFHSFAKDITKYN